MNRFTQVAVGAIVCALTASCGSDSGAKVSINMVKSSAITARLFSVGDMLMRTPGSNAAVDLVSLKYVFGFISICESLTTNGSQFSNPTGCIQIYSGPIVGDGSSGSITPSNLSTYASSQIDLMDATSLAKLNSSYTLTSSDARSYNWAVVNWYTPIAVKADVPCGGGTLHTKAASSYDGTSGFAVAPSLRTGSAEESVVVSPNGGSFFHFQTPFVVSSDDISAGTTYVVDMAFNPANVISGTYGGQGSNPSMSNTIYNSGNSDAIYVPMLSLVPVPRKSTDTSKKEIYTIALGGNRGTGRVELYYAASDTAKTITGVNVITALSTTDVSGSYAQIDNGSKIVTVTTAGDGSLTLKDNSTPSNEVVKGLVRGANSTVDVTMLGGVTATARAATFVGTVDVM